LSQSVRTTCPYCGVGCGVLAKLAPGGLEISGDPDHPANFGRLCSKGSTLAELPAIEGRLLRPRVADRDVSWDAALAHVAGKLRTIIEQHGHDAVAIYASGQLLTEDYYVANKLVKGYFGTGNIDTNSRLCMASAVAGHKRAFGEDIVPGCYEDLELADLIVLVGSNLAWCHPVIYQRIQAARAQRPSMRIVVIDPRRTATCEAADLHLAIAPGRDVWLFNGLLAHLAANGYENRRFVADSTDGLAAALAVATSGGLTLEQIAAECQVPAASLRQFYDWFATTERVVSVFSQGVNQSSAGTDKVNSIINCHLLTGRIGRPGMGPFSITGQPNAMGGREVGGLANMLAAHMDIENPAHRNSVQGFWGSPRIAQRPGPKAVELFDAVYRGEIKAVWIMATNPVVSLPDADKVRTALQGCELVVVSDCGANSDTARLAHVLLPAAAWGEKDGTVTNSERRISRQRAFRPPPGDARPDWWMVCEVAKRLGFADAFNYSSPAQIFDEYTRLTACNRGSNRLLDLTGLSGMNPLEYAELTPVQWPVRTRKGGGTARLLDGQGFAHANARARFIATPTRAPQHATSADYPLALNTGRIRDQWHTMTRTGLIARLSGHRPEPFVEANPQDLAARHIVAGQLVKVRSAWGEVVVRVRPDEGVSPGSLFVPMHWSAMNSSHGRVDAIVNPAVDPVSGEPEFKHTPTQLEPFPVAWHGFLVTREPATQPSVDWWAGSAIASGHSYEIAGCTTPDSWESTARQLLGAADNNADYLDFTDAARGVYRAALIEENRLRACLFAGPTHELPARQWLQSLLEAESLDTQQRRALLSGAPPQGVADTGPVVCSCHRVGQLTIAAQIRTHGLTTAAQVGERCRAGTNCGSCLPEIRALLAGALASGPR
jgi:assimilatory nitrate reductase catalytic subunit